MSLATIQADLDEIRALSIRAFVLVQVYQNLTKISVADNVDTEIVLTPAMKAQWKMTFDSLVAQIKAKAAGLP